MAEQGTFIGEVQRGWSRFWGSSWKVKGPIIGVVAFLVLAGIAGATSGDGERDVPASADAETDNDGNEDDTELAADEDETPTNTPEPTETPTPEDTATPTNTPEPTNTPTPTPTPTPTLTPTPSPTPEPAGYSFGSGTQLVGEDVIAGATYRAPGAAGCYWERLTGLGGTLDEIAANDNAAGPAVVTIGSNDAAFNSTRCGTWTQDLSPLTESQTAPFGPGTWIVGVDIAPGTWRAEGGDDGCYWARLSGFSGELDHIIANDFGNPSPVVSIAASDAGFTATAACGEWSLVQ